MSTTQVCDCSVVGLVQVVDYYKEACRALENSDTASMLGKIQKDWKKLVQMKISYFASIAHVSVRQDSCEGVNCECVLNLVYGYSVIE